MRTVSLEILAILFSFLPTCKKDKVAHGLKTPIAEYQGSYFYVEDLGNALPYNATADDSIRVITDAVNEWISNLQIQKLAERNIDNMAEIDRKVNEYRKQLLAFEYEKQLLERRVIKECTEEEVEKFYQEHKENYVAQVPLMKGMILKLPAKSTIVASSRGWMKKASPEDMENIEKESVSGAISYEYFRERWTPISEIYPGYKELGTETLRSFSGKKFHELSESDSFTFFKIDDFCMQGDPMPIEYAKTQIEELLHNRKEMLYMNQIRKELVDKAYKKEEVHFQGKFAEVMGKMNKKQENNNKK